MSVLPPSRTNKQTDFAQNLGGTSLGVALYSPLTYTIPADSSIPVAAEAQAVTASRRESSRISGKVGDVAFFTKEGHYQWLANAFDPEVYTGHAEAQLTREGIAAMELAEIL